MKILLYISIIVINISCLYSQSVKFNNTYGSLQVLRNVVVDYNQYIGLGGEYNEFGKVTIYIAGFDLNGNWIWNKNYGDSQYDYYHGIRNSLIKNNDDNYSLVGSKSNDTINACLLMKFDQNFDTLWTRQYFNNTDFSVFYNHIQTSDDGYALVGCSAEDDGAGDVLFIKTDNEGNIQWYKKYDTGGKDMGLCLVPTDDGGFLIGGAGDGDNYLIKTDSIGNLEWSRNYGHTSFLDGGIVQIIRTQDLGYVIAARETLYTTGTTTTYYHGKSCLKKLDSNFNELWYKFYGQASHQSGFGSIVETSDGGFAATQIEGAPSKSRLLFLNETGDSIKEVKYDAEGSIYEEWLLTIKQTPDNGFIMAGVAYEPQVMWLVKTDSCGCVTEDCDCGVDEINNVFSDYELEVFPNPANDILNYKLPDDLKNIKITIYDNLGRFIKSIDTKALKNTIDLNELMPGHYLIYFVSDEKQWVKRFTKE